MNNDSRRILPKQVFKTIMKFLGSENDPGNRLPLLVYQCPKPACRKIVKFDSKSGFFNPYSYLRSYFVKKKTRSKQEVVLQDFCQTAKEAAKKDEGSILSYFNSSSLTERDRVITSYLLLIIRRSLPISIVEDEDFATSHVFQLLWSDVGLSMLSFLSFNWLKQG